MYYGFSDNYLYVVTSMSVLSVPLNQSFEWYWGTSQRFINFNFFYKNIYIYEINYISVRSCNKITKSFFDII